MSQRGGKNLAIYVVDNARISTANVHNTPKQIYIGTFFFLLVCDGEKEYSTIYFVLLVCFVNQLSVTSKTKQSKTI